MWRRLDPVILLPGLVATIVANICSSKMREGLVPSWLESAASVVKVIRLLAETTTWIVVDGIWGSIEADLALMPRLLLLLRVLKSLLLVILSQSRRLLLFIGFHKLEPLSILHCGLILDRLLMLLVVECHWVGVQVQHLSQLVWHISSHFLIASVLEPHFQ